MKTYRNILASLICLLLALTACSIPDRSSEPSLNDQAATIVALTLDIQVSNTPTPGNTPLPTPTLSVTKTSKPTITPTYSLPLLTINESTNCRTGPGESYDILFTLLPGATVEIAGRYETNNYWTVKVQGLNEPCWIWGEFSTASGSYWTVPTVNPPPTTTASPPAAPSLSNWEYTCGAGNATVSMEWTDRAQDESGYRIYRDDEPVTELPPNSSAFSEVVELEGSETVTYRIEAFNSTGGSSSSSFSFSCQ